jgi:hypothetical protein
MKSSEMVRGSGYEMKGFALGAGRMLEDVRDMARVGIISQEDLRQFGGEQGIALSMARSAMNFAGSPAGFVSQAALMSAQLGGGGLGDVAGMGMQQQLAATAGLLSSPMAFARLFGAQQRLADEIGPEVAMQQKAMMAVEEMQTIFGRRRFTSEELFGALRVSGRSVQEAKQITWIRDQAGREDLPTTEEDYFRRGAEILRQKVEEGETPFGRGMRKTLDWVESVTWKPVTEIAETLYTGIERGAKIGGRALGREWTTFTGGIFEVDSTKMAGLESAWRIGGKYAERHAQTMALTAEQLETQNRELMNYVGDESAIRIAKTKHVKRTEEEMRQRGAPAGGIGYPGAGAPSDFKLITEHLTLDQLSADEASRELERYLENIGIEEEIGGIPGLGLGIEPLVRLFTGITHQSEISKVIEKTTEGLGMKGREFQDIMARSAAMLGQEYLKKEEAGEIKGDVSIYEYTRRGMIEEGRHLKLGKEYLSMIGDLTPRKIEQFQKAGIPSLKESLIEQQEALRTLAIKNVDAREDFIDADLRRKAIAEEVKNLGRHALLGDILGIEGKTIEEKVEATSKLQEKLAASISGRQAMFAGETEAGGFVFDEQASKIASQADIQRMSDKITTGIIRVEVISDLSILEASRGK